MTEWWLKQKDPDGAQPYFYAIPCESQEVADNLNERLANIQGIWPGVVVNSSFIPAQFRLQATKIVDQAFVDRIYLEPHVYDPDVLEELQMEIAVEVNFEE